jgi:hypothetical protein
MKIANTLLVGLVLALGGCLYNPTIDQEIADKCDISLSDFQHAEAALSKGHDGMSLHAGRCRLTRTSQGVTEGTVVGG